MIAVLVVLARLAGLMGSIMIIPLLACLLYGPGEGEVGAYLVPIGVGMCLFLASCLQRDRPVLNAPYQGFLCVVFGWIIFAWLGALPFYLAGALPTMTDAFFESMSGFTTTGASVFTSVAAVPKGLLLWRALTQYIGGLGIIALFVAVLPALGAGGVVLLRSEVSASVLEDRLRPRIRDTAKILWIVYTALCGIQFLLMWLCGVPAFDSLCHAFTTLSTGGFSTDDLSVGAWGPAVQWIVTVFMFLGGTSFVLHGKLLRGELRGGYLKNEEFLLYLGIVVVSVLVTAALLYTTVWPLPSLHPHPLDPAIQDMGVLASLRHAAFQVLSVMTTTGFATSDFDRWPDAARYLLVILMCVGSCSGSTAGGIKVFRILLLSRAFLRQLVLLLHPNRVLTLRMGNSSVPEDALRAAAILFIAFVVTTAGGAFVLLLLGVPMEEALTGTIACIMCIGPALGDVGPTGNYAAIPAFGKLTLSVLMLVGRLELYSVMVLLGLLVPRR